MISKVSYDAIVQRMLPNVHFHQNRYAKALESAIEEGDRWLDIGAGTKVHSGWIGVRPKELAGRCTVVVGCDLDLDHLSRNPSIDLGVGANAEQLPFGDNSFEVVTANMVLEHLENPVPVYHEIRRVLRPGGRFVFVTPNRNHPAIRAVSTLGPARARRVLSEKLEGRSAEHIFTTFYRSNTAGAIHRLAAEVGFEIALLEVFAGYPIVRRPWPAVFVEALWIRTQDLAGLKGLGSNLVGILRKA
jgi:ubiquinone/menaquinone biosynthesis C-methylase UbiE